MVRTPYEACSQLMWTRTRWTSMPFLYTLPYALPSVFAAGKLSLYPYFLFASSNLRVHARLLPIVIVDAGATLISLLSLEWFGAEWILRKTMISLILLIWYFEENRNWSRRCKFRFCQPLYCYHLLTRLRYGKTEKHPRYMVAAARKQKYMALYQQHMR